MNEEFIHDDVSKKHQIKKIFVNDCFTGYMHGQYLNGVCPSARYRFLIKGAIYLGEALFVA